MLYALSTSDGHTGPDRRLDISVGSKIKTDGYSAVIIDNINDIAPSSLPRVFFEAVVQTTY
jgi:hypothetical protein